MLTASLRKERNFRGMLGNTAGYKLQIFGSDKELPVSKANVPAFR